MNKFEKEDLEFAENSKGVEKEEKVFIKELETYVGGGRVFKEAWDALAESERRAIETMPMKEVLDIRDYDETFQEPLKEKFPDKYEAYKSAVENLNKLNKPLEDAEEVRKSAEFKKAREEEAMNRKKEIQDTRRAKADEHQGKRAVKTAEKAAAAGLTPEEYIAQRKQESRETQA